MEETLRKKVERLFLQETLCPSMDSYKQFCLVHLPDIIKKCCSFTQNFENVYCDVKFDNVSIIKPKIPPSEAYDDNQSYVANVCADVHLKIYDEKQVYKDITEKFWNVFLLPVLVNSDLCYLNNGFGTKSSCEQFGGYFIIQGKIRYIPNWFRKKYNVYFLTKGKENKYIEIRSEHIGEHRSTSTLYIYVNSCIKVCNKKATSYQITVEWSFLKSTISIATLVCAMGINLSEFIEKVYENCETEEYKREFFKYLSRLEPISQKEASIKIAKLYDKKVDTDDNILKSEKSVANILNSEIFPHLKNKQDKIEYLAHCVFLIIEFDCFNTEESCIDAYDNNVIEDSGILLAYMVKQKIKDEYIKLAKKNVRNFLKRKSYEKICCNLIFKSNLSKIILSAVATGNWSDKKTGITHQMNINHVPVILQQLRRVASAILNTEGNHIEARLVQPSSFGRTCPSESPDGQDTGLVLSYAIYSKVSQYCDPADLSIQIKKYFTFEEKAKTKVFDSAGIYLGKIDNVDEFIKKFKELRRNLIIHPHVSIYKKRNAIFFDSSYGRILRTVIIRENLHRARYCNTMNDLLAEKVIEFIDAAEEYYTPNFLSSFDPFSSSSKTEYLEISNYSYFGINAGRKIYTNHNQGPRTLFTLGAEKQIITNQVLSKRGAASENLLSYGQEALIKSDICEDLPIEELNGVNCNVAIFPLPENAEDSFVFNRRFIEFGGFESSSIKKYEHTNQNVTFEKPDEDSTLNLKSSSYDHINKEDGLPKLNSFIKENDVVMGITCANSNLTDSTNEMVVPSSFLEPGYSSKKIDCSVISKESGVVTQIVKTEKMTKIYLQTMRKVKEGDKFCTRHGQKGTIGAIYNYEDMPFSESTGMTPDVIISPTCIPSRMTYGQLLEIAFGKAAALCAKKNFDKNNLELTKQLLLDFGYMPNGTEIFRCGKTGKVFEAPIFTGPSLVFRLAHIAEKKISFRSTGTTNHLTRQPISGKAKGGATRFGEMENAALFTHGATNLIQERTMKVSDMHKVSICRTCGYIVDFNYNLKLEYCRFCSSSENIERTEIPYGSHLMFMELEAMGYKIKFCFS
jgi:DNA-directed RNA polymerase beta subunit